MGQQYECIFTVHGGINAGTCSVVVEAEEAEEEEEVEEVEKEVGVAVVFKPGGGLHWVLLIPGPGEEPRSLLTPSGAPPPGPSPRFLCYVALWKMVNPLSCSCRKKKHEKKRKKKKKKKKKKRKRKRKK
ncbi:unnamed protein product [Arctogadus glacialis]